jgi:hypothetical protein
MGDYYTNAVRHPEDVGVGYLRRTVTFDMAAIATGNGVPIGALEAGAIPRHVDVLIETVFNGTTPTLDVGIAGTPAGLAASASIAPGTLGWKDSLKSTLNGTPLAGGPNTAVPIYVKMGGTGVTTGRAIVTVMFTNKRELTGVPFPNNP